MGRPLAVIFLIDALGWEIAHRFDFCRDLLARRAPLGTVLGYSSAAIPSLLSGTTPAEHGQWAMWRRAEPGTGPFGYLRFVPRLPHALEWRARNLVRRITDRRRVIEGYYDLYEIPLHLLSHFDVSQHGDPYLPGGLSRETIFDRFESDGVSYRRWYYKTPEAENLSALLDSLGGDEDVLFLYTAELDALMHRVGAFDPAVERKLSRYENFVASVIEGARRADREVTVYVLSDHGMTDVHTVFDLWGALDRSGRVLGRDYLAFFDSTMARLWGGRGTRDEAAAILRESGVGRGLDDDELEAFGCLFEDRSYGETILLADPGVMFVPSFMGSTPVAAMHGYDPRDEYSRGCFLTNDEAGDPPDSILGFKRYLEERVGGGRS